MSDERSAGLGSAGPKPTITFEGTTYTFNLLTEGVMAKFSRALYERDGQPIYDLRPHMDPAEYQKLLLAHMKAAQDGEYLFENPKAQAFLETPQGMALLVGILLGADASIVMRMMLEIPDEVIRLMGEVIQTSTRTQANVERAVSDADPKLKARLLTKNLAPAKKGKGKGRAGRRKGRG